MIQLGGLHRLIRTRLRHAGVESADLDARLIVEHFTATTRTDMIAHPDMSIDLAVAAAIDAAIARRLAGEPVHRILGFREFHGLRLELSKGTLEPRPDTETLVDAVLPWVGQRIAESGRCRILDLGTGTGAIALAVLKAAPGAEAVGVDISSDAVATAQRNADANGLGNRFQSVQSDWFDNVTGVFDLIVSNPPYIRTAVLAELSPEVRDHDPMGGLDGGVNGLDAYRTIAESASRFLSPGGIVGVEIGYDQRAEVAALFEGSGWQTLSFHRDLGGNDRVILFSMPDKV